MRLRDQVHDFLMMKEVYFGNEYMIPAPFEPGSVVFDVGGHIGTFAVLAIHAEAGTVVSFEPDLENYELLVENGREAAKRLGTVFHPVRCAINDTGGRVFLQKAEHATMGRIGEVGDPVSAMTLDAALSVYSSIRFLKMDVEGYEQKILAASKMLRKVEEICVEVHPPESDPNKIREILEAAGMTVLPPRSAVGRVYLNAKRGGVPAPITRSAT